MGLQNQGHIVRIVVLMKSVFLSKLGKSLGYLLDHRHQVHTCLATKIDVRQEHINLKNNKSPYLHTSVRASPKYLMPQAPTMVLNPTTQKSTDLNWMVGRGFLVARQQSHEPSTSLLFHCGVWTCEASFPHRICLIEKTSRGPKCLQGAN